MAEIVFIDQPITRTRLKEIAAEGFGDFVKGVVDIEHETMVLGSELHADGEAYMLDRGSAQQNVWGINLYPDLMMPEMLEFDSMINIRPQQGNTSRTIADAKLKSRITAIVTKLVVE